MNKNARPMVACKARTIITILLALVVMVGQAQITLKGSIINERGEKIEYVNIGLEEDSGQQFK